MELFRGCHKKWLWGVDLGFGINLSVKSRWQRYDHAACVDELCHQSAVSLGEEMPTRKLSNVLGVIVVFFAIQPSAGQAPQVLGLAGNKSGLRLSVTTRESTYPAGTPVELRAEFRNVGTIPTKIALGSPSELFFRFNLVRMAGPNSASPVQLTPLGKERIDDARMLGTKFWLLQHDGIVGEDFDIGPWYDLPPGTYKIACYVDMLTDEKSSARLRYISNELTITITP
jgi:hypothetical protein